MLRRAIAGLALFMAVLAGNTFIGAEPAFALGLAQQPTASHHQDGRQIIFARATDGTPHYSEQIYSSGGFTNWVSLGGVGTSDIAAFNFGGLVHVFVRGTDNAVYWNRQIYANSGSWSGWYYLGGNAASAPTVARAVGGGLELYVIGTDGGIWGRVADSNLSWTGWATWGMPSGRPLHGQPVAMAEPYIGYGSPSVYLFVKASDSGLYWLKKVPGYYAGTWTGYGGTIHDDRVAVAASAQNTLEVFTRGTDGGIWHIRQSAAYGGWSGWWESRGFPGSGSAAASTPSVGTGRNGDLFISVVRDDGVIYRRTRTNSNLTWGSWVSMGGQGRSRTAAGRNANSGGVVFVVGNDQRMYQSPQDANNGSWPGFGYINSQPILKI